MKKIYLFAYLCLCSFTINAQLSAWQHKTAFQIQERSNTELTNYQVLVVPNTDSLISVGAMKEDGSDIRFSTDCDGASLLDYFIEQDPATQDAHIWVLLPTLGANVTTEIFMFYGNSAATAVSDFATVFPNALIVSVDEEIDLTSTTEWVYDWIEIESGVTVNLPVTLPNDLPLEPVPFNIKARRIKIDGNLIADYAGHSGGKLDAAGLGQGGGSPNGAGEYAFNLGGGGGGAYGGDGGTGGYTNANATYSGPEGKEFGSKNGFEINAGSGGAAACLATTLTNPGGNGGGSFFIEGASVTVTGKIRANGQTETANETTFSIAGAGGSGGGVLLSALILENSGEISCKGADASYGYTTCGSGGGSGGRIKFFYEQNFINSGITSVDGGFGHYANGAGSNGLDGESGTVFDTLRTSIEPLAIAINVPSQINLFDNQSSTVCQNDSITVFADSGLPSYEYFVNSVSQGVSTINQQTFGGLSNLDTISVVSIIGSCTIYSNNIVITVNDSIDAQFTLINNELEASFINVSKGGETYQWDFGDANTSSAFEPIHNYNTPGEYTVCLVVSNPTTGCESDTMCNIISVSCSNPTAQYNYNGNELDYTFTDVGNHYTSRQWKVDGIIVGTDSIFNFTFNSAGSYNVCLVLTNACGTDSLCQSIIVDCEAPVSNFDYSISGLDVVFNNLSSANIVSWNWDFGNTAINNSDFDPMYTYADSTASYLVCLTVFNACLDSNIYCETLAIQSTTAITENSEVNSLSVYPNPTSDVLHIDFTNASNGMVAIYTLQGQKIWSEEYQTKNLRISVADFPKGFYMLESISNGVRVTKQFSVN